MAKVEKITKGNTTNSIPTTVDSFSNYKGHGMVNFKGNFFRGGFNLSKSKVKAILDNLAIMQDFVNGKYDDQISSLKEDEILRP